MALFALLVAFVILFGLLSLGGKLHSHTMSDFFSMPIWVAWWAWHAVGCSSTCGALVAVMLNAIDVLHRYPAYSGGPCW